MSLLIIFGLLFVGLLLIIVEVIFIPGTTLVGIIGALLMITGIYFVYDHYGANTGNYTLIASVIANIVILIIGFRFITSNKIALQTTIDSKVNVLENDNMKIGDSGITFTDLRPNGKALLNGERVEVYSLGEYLEKNTPVEIVKISDYKIFVKPKPVV